jgi:hypothetical protein
VKRGHGSFLTLEFGQPHLVVWEPKSLRNVATPPSSASEGESRGPAKKRRRRLVYVHGEGHLWIHCCDWVLESHGQLVGDSSSKRSIDLAARELGGQRLLAITVDSESASSTFNFDLGARLRAYPYSRRSRYYDPTNTLWMLRVPSGHWLSMRSDGQYSYVAGNRRGGSDPWRRMAEFRLEFEP